MDFKQQLQTYVDRVETGLQQYTPSPKTQPTRLHEAMRYAIEGGGKRVRPVLALAACDLFGGKNEALPAAIAIECVHTYSLIHDDLPCMDNDDLRRGRPTVHKAYDEATALLTGDALLTFPFLLIASSYRNLPNLAVSLTIELADAAGSSRLIGGQMADLLAEKGPPPSPQALEAMHINKTASMIEASLIMGGLCGGANSIMATMLRSLGRDVGLAFQIIDDILDATSDSATLGKTAGKDKKADKATYMKFYGLEQSRRFVQLHTEKALGTLNALPGDTDFLAQYIKEMAKRIN